MMIKEYSVEYLQVLKMGGKNCGCMDAGIDWSNERQLELLIEYHVRNHYPDRCMHALRSSQLSVP